MARIVFTASASSDEIAILKDLHAKAGARTAAKFRQIFRSLFDRLADCPAIGAPRPVLGPGVRISMAAPYIVIYRHSAADDTVIRIAHHSRSSGNYPQAAPRW